MDNSYGCDFTQNFLWHDTLSSVYPGNAGHEVGIYHGPDLLAIHLFCFWLGVHELVWDSASVLLQPFRKPFLGKVHRDTFVLFEYFPLNIHMSTCSFMTLSHDIIADHHEAGHRMNLNTAHDRMGFSWNTTYRHGEQKWISDYTRYLNVSLSSSRGISQEQEPHTAVCRNTSKLDSFSSPAMWFLQQYFLPENSGEIKHMNTITRRKTCGLFWLKVTLLWIHFWWSNLPWMRVIFSFLPHIKTNKQTNRKIPIFMLQP